MAPCAEIDGTIEPVAKKTGSGVLLPPLPWLCLNLSTAPEELVKIFDHGALWNAADGLEYRARVFTTTRTTHAIVLTTAGCGELRVPAQMGPNVLGADVHR